MVDREGFKKMVELMHTLFFDKDEKIEFLRERIEKLSDPEKIEIVEEVISELE
tara:strand:- start:42 stop:200 length:159 start_codon:yes stop_codon:yes gene_type:complete